MNTNQNKDRKTNRNIVVVATRVSEGHQYVVITTGMAEGHQL